MQPIGLYLKLGFEHISDFAGFDHMLFLVALTAVYRLSEWRRILILVTAFTVGHSVTLAWVSLSDASIPSQFIEFLIPTTILLTAVHNVLREPPDGGSRGMGQHYAMALFFGLIHGMGFSNYFRALLMGSDSVVVPLLGFNVGIEAGQIVVVAAIVALSFVFQNLVGVKHREWNLFVSGAAFGTSLMLMAQAKFW
ncbi:MAG: HupE/UreJ family protein [Pseudomonadota bacterium]